MQQYRNEYKDYYDGIRKKVRSKDNLNEKLSASKEYIYPSSRNINTFTYQRGSYGDSKKKDMKYIDKFILRLICTFILFLGIFILKVIPSGEGSEIYNISKNIVSRNFNYEKILLAMGKVGIDYKEVFNIIGEKYTDVMGEIKKLDAEIPSFKEEGEKINIDEENNSSATPIDAEKDITNQ